MKKKRILALALALVMTASLLCIPALAAPAKNPDAYRQYEIYTCLGDSNAAGYAAEGYVDICTPAPGAYHSMVAQDIDAELLQFGWGGFRSHEVRHMLDPNWEISDWEYADNCAGKVHKEDLDARQADYVQAVIDADVITLNIGSNDIFGNPIGQAMRAMYNTDGADQGTLDEIKENLQETGAFGAAMLKMIEYAESIGQATELIESLSYYMDIAYNEFTENWEAIIENIYVLNPDVTLVAVSMHNSFMNMSISEGSAIKAGKLAQVIIDKMNDWMMSGSAYADKYIYCDVTDCECGEVAFKQEDFWEAYLPAVHPTAAGHRYMADQIVSVLPTYYPFTDVPEGTWCYEDVRYCFNNGMMLGTTETTFSPDVVMTRGMVAAVLYRLSGSPDVSANENPFNDVAADRYCTDAVKWAYANGIISGYEDGSFRPDECISRQQFAAMLYRYGCTFEYIDADQYYPPMLNFTDRGEVAEYAKTAMRWAVYSGVVKGHTLTTLDPNGFATRAQCAVMLARFDRNVVSAA